jgi:hypothetical protein
MEDVYVERVTAAEIGIVVTRLPAPDEDLLLDLVPHGGRRRVLRVRALRSEPLGVAGMSRHRVTLAPADGSVFPIEATGAPSGAAAAQIGVLVRRIPMSLTEVSARGCLIESPHRLPEGTVGVLELATEEGQSTEQLRICRMVRIVGGVLPYAAGAEFLPLEPPTAASVRNLVARLEMVLELDSRSTTVTLTPEDGADDPQPADDAETGHAGPS